MPEAIRQKVEIYKTDKGEHPFLKWREELPAKIRRKVIIRYGHLELGHFGDCKPVKTSKNLYELRIRDKPGYGVYLGRIDERNVIVLSGGTKSKQRRDIKKAKEYWEDYQRRIDHD